MISDRLKAVGSWIRTNPGKTMLIVGGTLYVGAAIAAYNSKESRKLRELSRRSGEIDSDISRIGARAARDLDRDISAMRLQLEREVSHAARKFVNDSESLRIETMYSVNTGDEMRQLNEDLIEVEDQINDLVRG